MSEINEAVKLVILKRKKEMYENTYYDLSIEFEIATELEDEPSKEEARKKMVKIKKAINLLEKKIEPIAKGVKDVVVENNS